MVLYAVAGSGLAGLALVLLLFLVGAGGGGGADPEKVRTAMEAAGCTLTSVKAEPNKPDHSDVPTPETKVKWNTFPPTNGAHYGIPAVYGAYTEPIDQTRLLHNLEHGGVYIQYGSKVPEATVAQLRAFYDDHRNGTLLAPLAALGNKIALGAWVTSDDLAADRGRGYLAKCTAFDGAAYATFFEQFQFKGPERFQPGAMQPGST